MSDKSTLSVCPECGARVSQGADRCELCGTELTLDEVNPALPEIKPAESPTPTQNAAKEASPGEALGPITCPACGATNRPVAVFCDQCATFLQHPGSTPPVPASASSKVGEGTDPSVGRTHPAKAPSTKRSKKGRLVQSEVAKAGGEKQKHGPAANGQKGGRAPQLKASKPRVGLLILGAVVVVVALYLITVSSKSSSTPSAPAPVASQPASADLDSYLPEDAGLAEQSETIRDAVGAESDPAGKASLQAQLVELYATNGRLDLAGREQEEIASETNSAGDWAHAGNFHFDWMEQQSGDERVRAAQRAAAAYQKSLEIDPADLDVRTDLGVAYLNDPASPMLAIRETNAVLETDPDHVQANFNKGVMLLQIGRTAEAIDLFEKVLTLTEPGTPAHDRAVEILQQIRSGSG